MTTILPPPPQKQDKIDEEAFLSFIREKFQFADPVKKKRFADSIEGVDFEVAIEEDQGQSYFIDEDSKECGITEAEYQFLHDDIAEQWKRAMILGQPGYFDSQGNFYPFPDNGKPRKCKDKKISPEDVAIARGIIKVHRPDPVEIEEEEEG